MENTFIPINLNIVKEAKEQPSKTYKLDLDKGRIVGNIDGIEAVRQAIRKAIITPRFKCLIYDNQYGSEIIDALLQKDTDKEYVEATTENFIKEALLVDTRILDINDFTISFNNDTADIKFIAETIFGSIKIEEEI